jgi:flagellar motor switch protein FliN
MSAAETWVESRTEHWVTAAWAEGACKALALLNPKAGAFALEARVPQPKSWLPWVRPVWILFPCDIDEGAGIFVGCSREVLQKLGALALGDPDDAGGLAAETYRELISLAAASVGAALQSRSGADVRFAGGVDVEKAPDESLAVEFRFEIDGEDCTIALAPNADFLEAIQRGRDRNDERGEIKPTAQDVEVLGDVPRRNLELLLDLEMDVAVSFGQTEMLLKDVLQLSVGSIVELKCQASDPVEVLVNGTVIAHGEVVVVDSNYGVRITDVSSRRERIQSIF